MQSKNKWIWQHRDYPKFNYNIYELLPKITHISHNIGQVKALINLLNEDEQNNIRIDFFTSEIVSTSEIEGEKLSLSIKKLTADPWKDLVAGFEAGTKVEGKVVRWNGNGVFLELKKDVTGLVPLVQFGVSDYSELKVKEGETIAGEVMKINFDSHRIMLKKEGYVEAPKEEAAE